GGPCRDVRPFVGPEGAAPLEADELPGPDAAPVERRLAPAPRAGKLARRDRADHPAAVDVDAPISIRRSVHVSLERARTVVDLAEAEHGVADDLEPARHGGARILGGNAGHVARRDGSLLEAGLDEPVDDAPVLRALADRVNVGIARAHPVIDTNAASDGETRVARELDVRHDAGRDNDGIASDIDAAVQAHGRQPHAHAADDLPDADADMDLYAEALDVLAKEHGGLVVELMEHQARLVLDDVDVSVEAQHRPRGLEPEETAADDDRRAARDLPREPTVRVGHAAKHMDAGQLDARDRRHARPRAGREHETLIAVHLARRVVHEPRATIDPDDAASRQHGYVSSERKPPVRVERAGRQLAREQRR